jgi:hypothetical protein
VLQHLCSAPGLRSFDESPNQKRIGAFDEALSEVVFVTRPKPHYPVSGAVQKFVDRLTSLTSEQWDSVQHTIGNGSLELSMLEASRNAAVALAVRDLISRDQFDLLYRPFKVVIPLDSLEPAPHLD